MVRDLCSRHFLTALIRKRRVANFARCYILSANRANELPIYVRGTTIVEVQ